GQRGGEGDEADGAGGVKYRNGRLDDAVGGDVAQGLAWGGADGKPRLDFVAAAVDAIGQTATGEGGCDHGAADDDPGDSDEGAHVTGEGGQPDDDANRHDGPGSAGEHDRAGCAGLAA